MFETKTADISIADLLKDDLQLTSPPALFFELKRIIDDPNKSLADAGNIIINDPALTMRILKLVNSAYFGFPNRVSTVTHAISIIGTKELQNLVLATLIIDKFSSQPDGIMSMHDFWAMSLRSALTATELALALHHRNKEEKESIFICGLLHEIGTLVFYRRIPELAREIGLIVEQSGETEVDIEQRVLGFNHYDTGAELARCWGLPAIIPETIAQHCKPNKFSPYDLIADLVRSSSMISKMAWPDTATNLHKWGITDDELGMIIDKVHDQFEAIFSIFYPA
jgi:HD-like signal output (HDOD) protein